MFFFKRKTKRKYDSAIQKKRPPIKDQVMFDLLQTQFNISWNEVFSALREKKPFDPVKAETALEIANKLVEMEPLRAAPWVYRSWILAPLGRCEESLEANHKAIEIDPSDPEKWAYRSSILRIVGRETEADEAMSYSKSLRKN